MFSPRFTKLLLFSLAALALSAQAASIPQLDATIPQAAFQGWNCNPDGNGPAIYEVRAFISNPYRSSMSVNFTYLDYPTRTIAEGGRACVIGPETATHCTFSIPVRLGGAGNGSTAFSFTLYGTFLGENLGRREKQFNVTLLHYSTYYETQMGGILSSVEAKIQQATAQSAPPCSGPACCNTSRETALVSQASFSLATASDYVKRCDLASAISHSKTAGQQVTEANQFHDATMPGCHYALQLYGWAAGNMTGAQAAVSRGQICGANVSAAAGELARADENLAGAASSIASGAYGDADSRSRNAIAAAGNASAAIPPCPSPSPPAEVVATPSSIPSPTSTPAPSSGLFSQISGYIGYAFIAAIILVAGAAAYMLAMRPQGAPGAERKAEAPKGKPVPREVLEGMEYDQGRLDREFKDWLEQSEEERYGPGRGETEADEEREKRKPRKAKPKKAKEQPKKGGRRR
ncbi:MAG: hypothetical protein PHF51_00430 [Candidatus ainarchaeum sp.]|nr:hypothetical protein [Candidatus ainarchaeum sp.]